MEKISKKKNSIVEAGRVLFYRYGLKKVTIDEICVEAGVSKMTFYKYFPNKLELAKHILNGMFEYWLGKFWGVMRSEASFHDKMHRFMEMKIEGSRDPSVDFVMGMYRSDDPEANGFIKEWHQRSISEAIAMFSFAQDNGWMRRDLKPELLLALLNGMISIFLDEKVMALYGSLTDLSREAIKFFLYGISGE